MVKIGGTDGDQIRVSWEPAASNPLLGGLEHQISDTFGGPPQPMPHLRCSSPLGFLLATWGWQLPPSPGRVAHTPQQLPQAPF